MNDVSTNNRTINIVLVDDHQIILDGLVALLNSEKENMRVIGYTNNPKEVLRLVRELKPDVLVLDLDLGSGQNGAKISGIDFLPQISSESSAKVLILTGERDIAMQAEAVNRGARGVILKNAPGDVIIQAVKKIAAGHRWHSDEILDYITTRQNEDMLLKNALSEEASNNATLTPTQLRVISTIAANVTLTNKEIAKILRISEHTLKNHLTEINSKLNTRNKMDLFMYAKKHKLDGKAEEATSGRR